MSVEQIKNEVDLEDVQCQVCFHVNHDPVTFKTCNHTFCAGCAARWLGTCTDCPMCRTRVSHIVINEELKKQAQDYLSHHPEDDVPSDTKWRHNCHETVFWAVQQRRKVEDPLAVFFGEKPIITAEMSDEEKLDLFKRKREENIWGRLEILKERIGEQTAILQQIHDSEMRKAERITEINFTDEDQEWRMVDGRGLVRVPRSINRFQCPLRFRRSHSS